nr:MAG: hypothetical protein [Molluscum contagiosum virus]
MKPPPPVTAYTFIPAVWACRAKRGSFSLWRRTLGSKNVPVDRVVALCR